MAALKITGVNVEVTEALRSHTEEKISVPLDKFSSVLNDAKQAELHLKVENRGVHDEKHLGRVAHIAEVTAHLKGKQRSITVSAENEDMYASIDELESLLARKLRKAKERWADNQVSRGAKGKQAMDEESLNEVDEEPASRGAGGRRGVTAKQAEVGIAPSGFEWGATY